MADQADGAGVVRGQAALVRAGPDRDAAVFGGGVVQGQPERQVRRRGNGRVAVVLMPGKFPFAFRLLEDGLVPVQVHVRAEKLGGDGDEFGPRHKRGDLGIVLGEVVREGDLAGPRDAFGPALGGQGFVMAALVAFDQGRHAFHFGRGENILQEKIAVFLVAALLVLGNRRGHGVLLRER